MGALRGDGHFVNEDGHFVGGWALLFVDEDGQEGDFVQSPLLPSRSSANPLNNYYPTNYKLRASV